MNECESISSKVDINGWPIWYEKFGSGSTPLLLVPGAIGTGRSDYWPQLEGDDALDFKQFTIIAVESPGWGRSRPPVRKYGTNVYNNDAECYYKLMQHLGYEKFAVIGWSDGAKSAMILAINYPDAIQGLIVSGATIYASKTGVNYLQSIINVKSWNRQSIDNYLRSYDNCQQIQELWTKYIKFVEMINQYLSDDMFKNRYHLIKSSVLVIYGEKDHLTDLEQSTHICRNIKRAKLLRLSTAGHDFHQKFPIYFKKLVEELLLPS